MHLSMATANFYKLPFAQALRIIKAAGFEDIELDGYWLGGDDWETAQHIKGIKPRDVVQMVLDNGLRIASFHDMGGVIEEGKDSVVARSTHDYLECFDFPCIVLHTPHRRTTDRNWWNSYRQIAKADLRTISKGRIVCLENMAQFEGYMVPLLPPQEMLEFAQDAGIHVTIDTTHYAQCNVDITMAAAVLKSRVKTVHLSDFRSGASHVFVGEGDLNLRDFYKELDVGALYSTTIECSIPYALEDEDRAIVKCRQAKAIAAGLICGA